MEIKKGRFIEMSRILIIEDEVAIADLEKDYLELSDFQVDICNTGDGGLTMALEGEYNLVVLDLMLPGMDGFEVCRKIREEKNIPILMVSAKKDDIDKIRGLGLGADDYLLKPFRDQELVSAIDKVRRKEQELTDLTVQDALPLAKGDKSKYVLQALGYIAEHYGDQDISITTIAQHLGVSEGHLSHVFKKETSYTIISYLTQYRVHTAMKLLQDCRYKVYEVAEMVGYRDVAYFGSTFKKQVGMSPSEYQDRCR